MPARSLLNFVTPVGMFSLHMAGCITWKLLPLVLPCFFFSLLQGGVTLLAQWSAAKLFVAVFMQWVANLPRLVVRKPGATDLLVLT